MKRNEKINNIRAFAILTVVFGHSIILYSSQWNLYEPNRTSSILDYVKMFINLYQMPLFFSISGYLFALRWKAVTPGKFIIGKIRRLLIPFLAIGMLWMIPIKMFLRYPNYEGRSYFGGVHMLLTGSDLGHLWYLPTLFLVFIIMYCVVRAFGNTRQIWVIALIIAIALNTFSYRIPTFGFIYLSYIYQYAWSFMLGAVIYKTEIEQVSRPVAWAIGIIAVVGSVFCLYTRAANTLIVSIAIILSVYLFMASTRNRYLHALSSCSFGIYLFHSPLIYITFTYLLNANPAIVVGINFLILGSISFIITYLIKKTQLKFVIGE